MFKNMKNKIIFAILISILAINTLFVSAVSASTNSVTPMNPWRYVGKKSYYQVKSTTTKYQKIWAAATKKWTENGFTWMEKDTSKTKLSTYSDSSEAGLKVAGKCTTSYRIRDGHINSNTVLLNRAALDKYDYTTEERICVAEHELGHALGLAHNNVGSVSVMNPSNRSYHIQSCDVKGMQKRYSTSINNDMVNGEESITVTEYFYVSTPKLENVKVKYRDNQLVITGKAKGISRVAAKYNKEVKTAEVKSGEFQLKLKYTKAKDIKLYGLNSRSEKITKNKTIRSEEFVTAAPLRRNISRTKEGITYEIDTEAGSLLTVKYKGKTIRKIYVDSSFERVFIPAKDLKGKKGKLTFTQKNTNKRVSKKRSYSIIKVGEKQILNY